MKKRKNKSRMLLVRAAAHVCGGQRMLSNIIGVSRSTIAQWLSGQLCITDSRADQLRDIIRRYDANQRDDASGD